MDEKFSDIHAIFFHIMIALLVAGIEFLKKVITTLGILLFIAEQQGRLTAEKKPLY